MKNPTFTKRELAMSRILYMAQRKAKDLQWDLDRMSRSGETTYFELLQILNTNF